MKNIRIFVDFGSTFTKAVAFDLDGEELVSRVQVPSTVNHDITIGLQEALDKLSKDVPIGPSEISNTVACSSAAGGLRVICVGLVPEFTTEASRMAALGAGAKIVGTYSYELSSVEIEEIEEQDPDIILLTGGTNGGNKKVIVHNAKMIAGAGRGAKNVIVAGNKSAYDEIKQIFAGSDKNIIFTKNVLPEIGTLDVEPSNQKIRELFINRITQAKGIKRVKSMINDVIMPTPSAVMEAAKIIADGVPGSPGLGELVLVDVGGATTDVYSVARGNPTRDGVGMIGLPQPYVKRTVEGDLGLVHNLETLTEIARLENSRKVDSLAGFDQMVSDFAKAGNSSIPMGGTQTECHLLLSYLAVKTGVERHVGRIEVIISPGGEYMVQRGKDLTKVSVVIGAGGPVSFSANPRKVMEGALFHKENPEVLKPKEPKLLLDKRYILFAAGLLAQTEPAKALNIIKKYLVEL